jgi:hypothetical protein
MNPVCHREERSDVAIHLEFQLDCHARQAGLAMTNPMSLLARSKATRQSSWVSRARFALLAMTIV